MNPARIRHHLRRLLAPLLVAATRLGLSSNAARALKPRARHLLAPLAVAATRLGLSSNAARALKPRARHLLAPLAVAVMLLGLASNAAAQGPGGVPEYSTFPAAQVFTVGVEITPVTLPAASGGDAPLTYTLIPTVPGLTLHPTTRVLTGTPTTAAPLASYFIRAIDVDDETTQINFDITVNAGAPTGLTLSVNPATVTESADATTITITATLVGGTFTENRAVLFASTATGSTATVDTDYTRVPTITTLTILAGQPSGTETFAFTALADTVAEPAGETVVIEGGVVLPGELNLDPSISVTTATITINDPVATVPTGITLSLDPAAVTESADATTITVTATLVGGTFAVARSISFGTGSGIGTATIDTDYTRVPTTNLTIPANMASVSTTFPFTAAVDSVAEPAGETVRIGGVLNAIVAGDGFDTSISVTHATITINDPVAGDLSPDFAADASIADQSFMVGETVALTLPGVTPGTGNISIHYALTPALPAGLTFNAGVRPQPTITGSPTAAAASAEYTYLVTDGDTNTARTDTDMLTFNLVVTVPVLAFTGNVSTLTLYYPLGAAITATTLPAATGGTSPYMYDTPAGATLPAGLTFNAATRTLSGTPSAAGSSSFNLRVTDSAMPAAMVSLEVTTVICESGGAADGGTVCAAPAFVPLALATPAEQAFRHIVSIAPVTLPEATGGFGANPVRIYTLTPLPVGLDFDPSTRVISGRPEEVGTFTVNYRVGDAGAGNADAQSTTVMFDLVVFTRPFLAVISDQVYVVGGTVALTLTGATGGSPPYTYTLSNQGAGGALTLPAGLTWNTDVSPQTVTGMPTAVTARANYIYEVTDSRSLTSFKPFSITVNAGADTTPAFAADASIADQFYTVGQTITPLTLPEATGGNGALTYALLAPPGLNFDLSTRVLSGTPTTAATELTYSYFARDADNDGVALLIKITVNAPGPAPAFAAGAAIPTQRYAQGTMITPLTFPEATGGTAPLTYALTRPNSPDGLPPGLTFNDAARPPTLTGTPTERTGARGIAIAYTVTDGDGDTAASDSDTLFFTLNISPTATLALDFPVTTGIGTQPNSGAIILYFPLGAPITPVTFPEASGGTAPYTYGVGGARMPPFGLTFDADFRVLSGTPTAAGVTAFRYEVTDSATPEADEAFVEPRISICASGGAADGTTICTFPAYTDLELPTPVAQSFIRDETITNVTLPEATAGGSGANPVLIYSATPLPAGLTFEPSTRVISGMPTTNGSTTVNYRVGDAGAGNADDASVTVTFDIVIVPPGTVATGFTVSVEPTTVIESDTPTDLTVRVTLTGGSLAATRVFEIGTQAGTATADTDYTPLTNTLLTLPTLLPANTLTVPFTALTDSVADDGETLSLTVTFLNGEQTAHDPSLGDVNLTTITINDPVAGDTAPAFAADAAIPFQRHIVGTAVNYTLPEATGGNDALTYTLVIETGSAGLPTGLTFNADARPPTITGTPTEATRGTRGLAFIYTVADADDNTGDSDGDRLFFTIEAFTGAPALAFPRTIGIGINPHTGTATLYYPLGAPITPTTFPEASGGTSPYTYGTTGSVPVGLTFDATGRVLSGTPTVAGSTRFEFVAIDTAMPANDSNLIAEVVICESGGGADGTTVCPVPTFVTLALPTPADQSFASGATVDLTLPEATGGVGTNPVRIYTAMPLPAGLTFNPMTRAITGMPEAEGTTTVNYRVGDTGAGNTDFRSTTVMFDIVVTPPDTAPAFADGAAIPHRLYVVGTTMITPVSLPEATGGNDALTYTLARVNSSSGLPPGLTFNADARPPTITGTPSQQTGGLTPVAFAYTVMDGDGNMAAGDSDTLFFSLGVFTGALPVTFPTTTGLGFEPNTGTGVTLFYPLGAAITPTTFPAAIGGTTPYTYSTISGTPPPGLTFDAAVRVLSGTPTVAGQGVFNYRVDDSAMPSGFRNLRVSTTICESGGAADGATACPIPAFVTLALPTPDNQAFAQNALVDLTLPAATGGTGTNPVRIYTATPLPVGLGFDPATRVISGRAEGAVGTDLGTITVNYRVGDAGAGNADHLSITVTFDITVGAELNFAFLSSQTYTVGDTVAYSLPTANPIGTGALTYTLTAPDGTALTLPDGLTHNAGPRTITGVPTTVTARTEYRYTVTDSLGVSRSRISDITVNADIAPAFAADATIPPLQLYVVGTAITSLTFPEATGGNAPLTYAVTPALPAGVTFDAAARPPTITGTPTGVQPNVAYTYTVTDGDGNMAVSDADRLFFTLGVSTGAPALAFPDAVGIGTEPSTGAIKLFYPLGEPITPTTFSAAGGGTPPYIYSTNNGMPPVGLTFDASGRVLSGTPTLLGASSFSYVVTDMPSEGRTQRANVVICESGGGAADGATVCPIPAFVTLALPTPDDQSFVSGALITPVTLPEATAGGYGANPVRIYSAMPLPAGLTFNPMTRAITGTPTAVATTTVNYRVGDAGAGNADFRSTTVMFDIVVAADTVPAFAAGETIPDQFYTQNTEIKPLTLPAVATAGNGDTVYVFNPPRGLTFDPSTRVLTGAPIGRTSPIPGEDTLTYTARDSDGNMAAGDEATLTFRLAVVGDTAPAFAVTDIMTRTYFMNEVVALTLPAATGGNDPVTYTLTGATLPAGLTFDGTASPPTITGTAGTAATAMTFTYTAMDADDDAATLTISITVETMADTTPTFAADAMVADQTFVQNRMLSLTLPAAATAGNGATIYTLTPAIAGLTLNPTTGVLTGTPEATAAETMYTYTASDSDGTTGAGDEATLTLQITVERQDPTGVRLSVEPDTVRESVAATTITVTATLVGGTFGVERVVRFLTSSGVGTATEATDYTVVPATLLTLPANMASGSMDIRFTAPIDTDDEPAGETVIIGGFLQLPMGTGSDPSVPLTPATLTINDYTIIVGNAGPDQRVAPGDTIMLNAAITAQDETAVVVLLWDLRDTNAVIAAALVAAGVEQNAANREAVRLRGPLRNFNTLNPSIPAPVADLGLTSAVELVFTFTASDTNAPLGYPREVADEIIITVVPDTAPAFAVTSIPAQNFVTGAAVDLTLPQATGGDDAIVYTLTPAIAGLTLEPTTGVLSGAPTTAAAATDYTYTAADSDANEMAGDQTSLTVSITVRTAATGLGLGVSGTQGGFAVTVVREGSSRDISVSAVPAPAGSGFAVDQTITFEFTPPPAAPPANAADPYVGYTAIAPGTIPFPVGSTTSPSYDFTLAAIEDNLDHADLPVTITVTAQPSGLTETATVTLTDNDISILTTAATASVAAAATTTYDVTLGEAPSADTTVAVASQAVGTATVSPATLLFTTTNWNAAQTVTVTGVAVGSTTIRHTAPAAGGFSYVTNDVAVMVAAAGTIPTFASDAMISDQTFTQGTTITPLTLPTATGTAGRVIIHALTPAISGMNFDSNTLILSGAPDTVGVTEHTYTAVYIDAASTVVKATLAFTVTVEAGTGTDTAPTFGAVTISPQVFTIGTAVDLTLPAATGGNGAITYTLLPAIPGLTLDAATGVLTGMPTTAATATDYTYTAGDTDGSAAGTDEATLTISITVNEMTVTPTVPTFGDATIDDMTYTQGTPITPVTLPVATGGFSATLFYSVISAALPDGLTFTPATRVLSGTPTTVGMTTHSYRVADVRARAVALMFTITVNAAAGGGTPPTGFTVALNPAAVTESATPTDITVTVGLTGGTFTVARAFQITTVGGGSAERDIDYTRLPLITLTIPANMASASVIIPFTATDDMVAEPAGETVDFQVSFWDILEMNRDSTLTSPPLTVLTINDAPTGDTAPTFGGATTPAQVFTIGTAVDLTLPTATGGNGAITYALTPAIPGLTLDAATGVLTGTPTTEAAATDYTYTAADGDDNTDADDAVSLMFSITIEADTTPSFGGATVSAQTFTIGTAVDLTLPAATGGNGDITYTLTPAIPGLTLDAATGVLTGTPTTVAGATMHTYTAGDADGSAAGTDEVSLMFSITVMQAPPSSIDLSFTPAAVTESDDPTTITVTANLIGGAYSTARNITVVASADGSATEGDDYTAVPDITLTIPADGTSDTATFMFTAPVDAVAEAGGETVLFTGTLLLAMSTNPDTSITASSATLTINDYALVVDAGPDQTVASGGTITLNGEITSDAGATVVATWALSDSVAARAALVEAGLMPAEATTEVTRLTTALGTITTPGGTLTAPAVNLGLTDPVALAFTLSATDSTPPAGQTAATAMDEVTITVEAAGTDVITTTALNEAILPEVTRALVNSTSSSITRRVGQAVGSIPVPTVGSFNLAGQSMDGQDNLAMALRTQGEAMSADSRDIKEILAGSDFVLPLNATGGAGGASPVAFWGSGEYRDFSGESDDLDWDGDLTGFQLGLDARLRDNLLVGVAVSMLETDVDYEDDTGILGKGDYELDMTSAHPYIGWRSGELDFWATVGYGTGDLEIKPDTGSSTPITDDFDVNLLTVGGGGSGMLWQDGTTTLRLKGEVSQTTLEVEGETFAEQEIDATSIRIAVEATRSRRLAGGGIFEPSVEVAARHDGGDGETGGGAEVGGALRYRNPATGLTADGRIRALMGQGGNYEEWGISGTVRVAPGTDGQGLSFSLSPGYGDSGSGIQELWRHGLVDENDATTDDYAMKLDARVGYGFGFILNEHHGILTPYSELTYGGVDSYRMGLNWAASKRFDLTLLGERREPTTDPAEHAVLLKGEVRF